MGTGYDKADEAAMALIAKVMHEYHGELEAAGVTIQALFAHKYNDDGELSPAMKLRGHQVLAKIAITSLQDRVRGIPDAKLIIDREYGYARLSESRRVALVDRELTRLTLVMKDDGLKLDDAGRPKLKLRHWDYELEGFEEVWRRHGEAAVEARAMILWQESWGQGCLFPLPGAVQVNGTKLMDEFKDPEVRN